MDVFVYVFDGDLFSFFLGACLEWGLLNHRLGVGLL